MLHVEAALRCCGTPSDADTLGFRGDDICRRRGLPKSGRCANAFTPRATSAMIEPHHYVWNLDPSHEVRRHSRRQRHREWLSTRRRCNGTTGNARIHHLQKLFEVKLESR